MRFMVMHKVDANMEAGGPPPTRIVEQMGSYVGNAIKAGVFEDGAGLHRSALRVRVGFAGGKRTVTKGPYAGGNELLAGFVMVKAPSIDHAVELAAKVAAATGDTEIEIGPVVEPWDIGVMKKPENPPTPRFLLLRKEAGQRSEGDLPRVLDEWKRDGVLVSAAALAPSSQGARYQTRNGKREWTDGPFAESKELVAGFSIVNLPSLADAKRWTEAYGAILGDNEVDVRVVATP
jgi:hypothetical protein